MNYYQQPCYYGVGLGQPMVQPPVYAQPMPAVPPFGQPGFPDQMVPPGLTPQIPQEQSYIENILRLNIGKTATIYMNFEGSQWGSKIFKGTVLAAGKDHLILKDLNSEMRYVLLTIFLSYITFDEEINYEYPFRRLMK
jgi:spore germination protein Q